jgi:ribosomal protein L37AE/L43A
MGYYGGRVERMKDSSKLLGFNQNRDLYFNEFRSVDFPIRRDLQFDENRNLSFDSERDIPFGKKGVEFRHFICGGCGKVVNGEAKRCPKCRATFKGDEQRVLSSIDVRLSKEIEHSSMKEHFGDEYIEERMHEHEKHPTYRCRSCGNNLRYVSGQGKWYCDRCKIYIRTSRRGSPRKKRTYTPRAATASGVKFVPDQRPRRYRASDVVVVEDINRRKRRR